MNIMHIRSKKPESELHSLITKQDYDPKGKD
jgi:hypothetical protein